MVEEVKPINCSTDQCAEEAEYLCTCVNPNIYLCAVHVHRDNAHKSSPLYKAISDYDRKKIIDLCKKCKNDCYNLKSQILKDVHDHIQNLNKSASNLTNSIRQVELLYDSIILTVTQINKVKILGEQSLTEKIIAHQAGNNDFDLPYWTIPNVKLGFNLVPKENSFDLYEYFCEISLNSNIILFKQGTKRALSIHVNTYDVTSFSLNCPDNLSQLGAFCYLPDGSYFHSGGNNGGYNNNTYIVNPLNKTFEKKANCNYPRYNIGCACYYKENIYVFGGYHTNGSVINYLEKYDIRNNTWTNLTNMPQNLFGSATVVSEGGIFVTGNSTSVIFKYNITNNNYDSQSNLASGAYKILCSANNILYLFDTQRLLQYGEKKTWEVITASTVINSGHTLIAPVVRMGDSFFMLLNNNTLYRFNFLTKAIEQLTQIPI